MPPVFAIEAGNVSALLVLGIIEGNQSCRSNEVGDWYHN